MVSPRPGFAGRFEERLAKRRFAGLRLKVDRLIVLLLGGAGLLFCLTALMQLVETGKTDPNKPVVTA
jgi:hypothetical protein